MLSFLAIALRRPGQILHPSVWVEDGLVNLRDYIEHGFAAAFMPLNGYFVLPTKLINVIGLTISVRHYPELASAMNALVCSAVVVAIAVAPTVLRARVLCAVATLLVPCAPEVFGVSLYAFWWTSILVVLAALWEDATRRVALRCAFIIIGGFSSPVVVGLIPIFALQWFLKRTHAALIALATALACAAVQLLAVLRAPDALATSNSIDAAVLIQKYIGQYFVLRGRNHEMFSLLLGCAFIAVMAVVVVRSVRKRDWRWFFMMGVWAVCIAMSAARSPLADIHPVLAGPRYFFLPYALIGWILATAIVSNHAPWQTIMAAAALIIGCRQSSTSLQRNDDVLDWQASLHACATGEVPYVLVQYDGRVANAWRVPMHAQECATLLGTDAVYSPSRVGDDSG